MTSELQSPNLPPQETSFNSVPHYSKQVGTLRSRLLTSILPAVLIPLVVASAIGYTITERKAKNRVLERLENQAILASTRIDAFIRDSFDTFDLIAANPQVMQAMKAGSQKAQDLQLNQKSIADLEKQFTATKTTQKVAAGDLDIQADIEGTLETRTLADSFNKLVRQVRESLKTQQILADEQRQAKEDLETSIYTLIDEISEATEGDLTVRANLNSIELSTVADLFNAIINNLQEIAIEAKQSTSKVGTSLKQNEDAIRLLAKQATVEAEETRNTLLSIEQMSQSIQAVAHNANQAEQIVDDTYNTVLTSTENMDLTVNSIVDLRNTVGETAKKMKRLGESSQKIYQAVSFIEEIALRTNILAINATVEAGRAGEYGEGFTIVAEQVATLAEQSAAATKEIAGIVTAIQAETQEVNQAMESGTTQVVETTRLIESTKESLNVVLEKSQEINQLMKSISENTLSQADTSQNVTNLMQQIAQLSETTSKSSQEVAQSIMETAQVAAKLESAVSQFKVAESA